MERKLAKVAEITGLFPINGADRIECAEIDHGWQVVVKRGEFKVWDKCVFFEIDSFLPPDQRYEFLRASSFRSFDGMEGFRLKSIRLKGQISQGLALPLSAFPELENPQVEDDLTVLLNVKKYEKPLNSKGILSGDAKGSFPSFIPKTDADRVQNSFRIIGNNKDSIVETSIKLDGSSFTCYFRDGVFGVCSRNLEKKDGDNAFWNISRRYMLKERLEKIGRNVALQGELCGPGIQKNKEAFSSLRLKIFNVFDIDKQQFLPIHTFVGSWTSFIDELNNVVDGEKIETVDIISVGPIFATNGIKDLLILAEAKSVNNPAKEREGIVFKFDSEGVNGRKNRHTLKAISNKFLFENGQDEQPEAPDEEPYEDSVLTKF